MSSSVLSPGANAPLTSDRLAIRFRFSPSPGAEPDVSAFLVGAGGRVRSDADMCFYGQTAVAGGALRLGMAGAGMAQFDADLARLPADIEKVIFAATIHENRFTFSAVGEIGYSVDAGPAGLIPAGPRTETALILAEAYRHKGAWKIRTVGQGFNGGLPALATHLGVEIEAPGRPAPAPVNRPAPPPMPEPAPPISLSKISLTKAKSSVSLRKTASGGFGKIRVNLNWNQKRSGGVFGGLMGGSAPVDLDLGCFIEDKYGQKTCVQALGGGFGDYAYFPYARLLGDDRTGAVSDGEWLEVNGDMWPEFNRILIFAFIYEGAPNWAQTDGVIRVLLPDQPEIEVRMNEHGSPLGMCAVATLENDGGQIRVGRENRFFRGHRDMDRHYGWGMNWVAGSK